MIAGSNSRTGSVSTQSPVSTCKTSSSRMKPPCSEPNNSPVSSAEVMMHNTKFPSGLHLQLYEQQ